MSKRPGHRTSQTSKRARESKAEEQRRKKNEAAKRARAEQKARDEALAKKRSRAAKRGWKTRKADIAAEAIKAAKRTGKRKTFGPQKTKPGKRGQVPSTRAKLIAENKRMREKVAKLEEKQERLKKHVRTLHKEMSEPEDIDKVWLKMGFKSKRMKEVLETLRSIGKITFERACYDIADDFGIEPREVFRWYFGY